MNKYVMGLSLMAAAMVVGLGVSIMNANNYGNAAQVRIHTMYQNNENIFAQYGQKVAEAVGVTAIAKADMADLLSGSLEARYGTGGSQATLMAVTEAFPGLDQGIYAQVQRIIESGRNDFTVAQTQLIDAKRSYVTALGSFPKGKFLSMMGYPSINIGYPLGTEDDYPIVSTTRAADTFESGVEVGNALSAATGG